MGNCCQEKRQQDGKAHCQRQAGKERPFSLGGWREMAEAILWLSSNKGIIHYMPDSIVGKQFKQYTSRDGLSSDEYLPSSALKGDDGYLWFGSTKGVDVFHPGLIEEIGKPPQLAINSLKIHDKEWDEGIR